MTGLASYASDRDAAAEARAELDDVAAALQTVDVAQRAALERLIRLWPTAAWLVAGAKTARAWLVAHAGMAGREAKQLERIAELCASHPPLADAVVSGSFRLAWAGRLARVVTSERAPFLAGSLDAFIGLAEANATDDDFDTALRYWAGRVDEHVKPKTVPRHSVVLSRRLFGGGQAQIDLGSAAFETFATAIDAWTQDPDPEGSPYVRPLSERRADGLDDMCHFATTHDPDRDVDEQHTVVREDEEDRAHDTYDGTADCDDLDIEQEHPDDDLLDRLRVRIRRAEDRSRRRSRRRIRRRSGVTTNVHIDLKTLSGTRAIDDFDGLVLRGDKWGLARSAAEQLICDSRLLATLFAGRTKVLDANTASEQFSLSQRRAIAARDRGCIFPGCQTHPRHCDIHHLQHREHGGPTTLDNAASLCRFHHRLVHDHRWTLSTTTDGGWVATDPHGTVWTNGRSITDQSAA